MGSSKSIVAASPEYAARMGMRALYTNVLPDWLIRLGTRQLLASRLTELTQPTGEKQLQDLLQFAQSLKEMPIAVNTEDSKAQHYEVPTEFDKLALGKHLKYRGNGDRLILRRMRFHGNHGVFPEERTLGQKFDVDLDAWMDLSKAGETDNLDDSVSYAEIYSQIRAIVEGPPHFLLESVATAIAKAVLEQHPRISDVRVRVGKPHVGVVGMLDVLGVEIFRSSSQFRKHHNTQKTPNSTS